MAKSSRSGQNTKWRFAQVIRPSLMLISRLTCHSLNEDYLNRFSRWLSNTHISMIMLVHQWALDTHNDNGRNLSQLITWTETTNLFFSYCYRILIGLCCAMSVTAWNLHPASRRCRSFVREDGSHSYHENGVFRHGNRGRIVQLST